MTPASPIRVLVVDDHAMVRAGLRVLLDGSEGIAVVGEAADAASAIACAADLRPHVVLMDLRLPDASGLDACREILSTEPATRVIILTSYPDQEAAAATILAGASGFLLKDVEHAALLRAVADAAMGRPVSGWPGALAARGEELLRQRAASGLQALSRQERRIMQRVVEGMTNREIAASLGLSEKTVKNYLSNIFQKLGVARRAQAAVAFSSASKPEDKP